MSSAASESITEPPPAVSRGAIFEIGPEEADEIVLAIVAAARTRLIEVEIMLRDLWYDTVDSEPAMSARLNVAARFAHNAAEALSPQTLF